MCPTGVKLGSGAVITDATEINVDANRIGNMALLTFFHQVYGYFFSGEENQWRPGNILESSWCHKTPRNEMMHFKLCLLFLKITLSTLRVVQHSFICVSITHLGTADWTLMQFSGEDGFCNVF